MPSSYFRKKSPKRKLVIKHDLFFTRNTIHLELIICKKGPIFKAKPREQQKKAHQTVGHEKRYFVVASLKDL